MHNNIAAMIIKKKPATVKASLMLLLAGIVIGTINSIYIAFSNSFILPLPFLVLSSFFILLQLLLLNIIRKGYAIGRLILAVLTAFGLFYSLTINESMGAVFWIIGVMDIAAIVFLYVKQSSEWFVKISNSRRR